MLMRVMWPNDRNLRQAPETCQRRLEFARNSNPTLGETWGRCQFAALNC
jgi:hypothetical protein